MLIRALGPGGVAIYSNLGAVLMAQYRATGNVDHLDRAIAVWRRAVSAPGGHPEVVPVVASLAVITANPSSRSRARIGIALPGARCML